jgi:calcium binding protein 39
MLRFLRDANNVSHLAGEDEQLDEERDLIIKEIEKLVRLSV